MESNFEVYKILSCDVPLLVKTSTDLRTAMIVALHFAVEKRGPIIRFARHETFLSRFLFCRIVAGEGGIAEAGAAYSDRDLLIAEEERIQVRATEKLKEEGEGSVVPKANAASAGQRKTE